MQLWSGSRPPAWRQGEPARRGDIFPELLEETSERFSFSLRPSRWIYLHEDAPIAPQQESLGPSRTDSEMEEPQTLERALGVLACTFQRYCRAEGERHTLSRSGMKQLLENELPSLQLLQIQDAALDELLALLDKNRDRRVDFEEYIRFVTSACTFFHSFFNEGPGVQPRVAAHPEPHVAAVDSEARQENREGDAGDADATETEENKHP